MKFITAMTLGVLSLSALAKPIITEGERIFHDSKDFQKIYFVPDQVVPAMLENKPWFHMDSFSARGNEEPFAMITGMFDIKKSDQLEAEVEFKLFQDFQLAKLPTTATYTKINPEMKPYLIKPSFYVSEIGKKRAHVHTDVKPEYINILSEKLKKSPASVSLFSVCYMVEGVTPILRGTFSYNLNVIKEHLESLPRTEASYEELQESIDYLVRNKKIYLSRYGIEGSDLDYVASLTRSLIPKMFDKNENEKFTLKKGVNFPDLEMNRSLNGAEDIKKEFCIDADLDVLEAFPENID